METTRGGKWRACKKKNAAKHEGGGGEGGREFEERRIRESYFNILSALRGITHTHEWTANIWNGPQTWRGWPPPLPLREKGKRIVRRRAKNCRLKLLISFVRSSVFHHLLGWKCMWTGYRPISDVFVIVSFHISLSKSPLSRREMLEDGIAIIRVNCTPFRISFFRESTIRGTRKSSNFFFFFKAIIGKIILRSIRWFKLRRKLIEKIEIILSFTSSLNSC